MPWLLYVLCKVGLAAMFGLVDPTFLSPILDVVDGNVFHRRM